MIDHYRTNAYFCGLMVIVEWIKWYKYPWKFNMNMKILRKVAVISINILSIDLYVQNGHQIETTNYKFFVNDS